MSSKAKLGRILIRSPRRLFPIELLDANYRLVDRAYGMLDRELPAGLYLARCEAGGPSVERLFKVREGVLSEFNFSDDALDLQPSAAPVPGSASRHEYFTDPVTQLVNGDTRPQKMGTGARLVFFANRLDNRVDKPSPRPMVDLRRMSLRNQRGRIIAALGDELGPDPKDVQWGRAGVNFDLKPGGYFLSWPPAGSDALAEESVVMPVWLTEGWTTGVFAGVYGKSTTPRRDSVSIHMFPLGEPLKPYDEETSRVLAVSELAHAALRTGRQQIDETYLRTLLRGKFQNPMLGILGAHFLVQEKTLRRDLLEEVLGNLTKLLGKHPDVVALRFMARAEGNPRTETKSLEFPPMVRAGLLALSAAEWQPDQVPVLQGIARLARLRLQAEGLWTYFVHRPRRVMYAEAEPVIKTMLTKVTGLPSDLPPMVPPPSADFMGEEEEAKAEVVAELHAHLQAVRQQEGRNVGEEHFAWTGLNPADIRAYASAPARA